jgi:hypothetical protein
MADYKTSFLHENKFLHIAVIVTTGGWDLKLGPQEYEVGMQMTRPCNLVERDMGH